MEIVDVHELLSRHRNGTDRLRIKRLCALEPRREPFEALLCQPHGTIHASEARIGNADAASACPMYRAFLHDAVNSQVQLAITPEYSVPWQIVRELLAGELRPAHGSMWILGCESIAPDELDDLQNAVVGNASIRLIYEPFDPQQRVQRRFVDPLVFVFWATDAGGADVLCLLVQFKTVASRDEDHVELTSLYLGSNVYKFVAQADDIALIALICSDAFEFTTALVDEHNANLLLVHIQLNKKPAFPDYALYRTRLFSVASNNNVEILCLNWAANVLIEGVATPWNAISGSAWYVAPRGVTAADADINRLHRGGLYYSIVGERWHAFYFNFSPHSLRVSKQPVFAVGQQVLAQRIAPQVVARRAWDAAQSAWADMAADDGFTAFVQPYAALSPLLPQMCEQDPLAVERALELLDGTTVSASDWYALKNLRALRVGDEESLCRVTVSQETDDARDGVVFRKRRTRRAQTAATIPTQPVAWPQPVNDLAAGFRYRWNDSDPHSNVEPTGGGRPAALIYLDEDPEGDTLENVHAKVSKARKLHASQTAIAAGDDPGDAVIHAVDRLCVAYKQNHELKFYRPPGSASITNASGPEPDDISGEDQ